MFFSNQKFDSSDVRGMCDRVEEKEKNLNDGKKRVIHSFLL